MNEITISEHLFTRWTNKQIKPKNGVSFAACVFTDIKDEKGNLEEYAIFPSVRAAKLFIKETRNRSREVLKITNPVPYDPSHKHGIYNLEQLYGKDGSEMLGFAVKQDIRPWTMLRIFGKPLYTSMISYRDRRTKLTCIQCLNSMEYFYIRSKCYACDATIINEDSPHKYTVESKY